MKGKRILFITVMTFSLSYCNNQDKLKFRDKEKTNTTTLQHQVGSNIVSKFKNLFTTTIEQKELNRFSDIAYDINDTFNNRAPVNDKHFKLYKKNKEFTNNIQKKLYIIGHYKLSLDNLLEYRNTLVEINEILEAHQSIDNNTWPKFWKLKNLFNEFNILVILGKKKGNSIEPIELENRIKEEKEEDIIITEIASKILDFNFFIQEKKDKIEKKDEKQKNSKFNIFKKKKETISSFIKKLDDLPLWETKKIRSRIKKIQTKLKKIKENSPSENDNQLIQEIEKKLEEISEQTKKLDKRWKNE